MAEKEQELSDSALVAEIRKGNQRAFEQLFDKYWEDLYKTGYKRLPSSEDIKDILQEVFLSLWNNIDEIDTRDSIAGYLFVSLKNKILNYYDKRHNQLKHLVELPFNPVESEDSVWNQYRTKEMQKLIAEKARELPPKMKHIYHLSKTEQLTIGEIAELLHLSPQTVKNQLHRALERLRNNLKGSSFYIFLFF